MQLIKPKRLNAGDNIATVSISHGWAGDNNILWKYELGKKVLHDRYELNVIAAPNSMKGSKYLSENLKARAEDLMWAFENKEVNAIIANIGGNDSIRLLPFIDTKIIHDNPKVFIGYSDIMNIHLLCYKCGLSTFYGHNLLYPIAEAQRYHKYSEKWFEKALFCSEPIGVIEPSPDWTFEATDYENPKYVRKYYPNDGYRLFQGEGSVVGRLFGGHTGMMDLTGTLIELCTDDFNDVILFVEDIPEFFSPENIAEYFQWLGKLGALQKIRGVIIGKINENIDISEHKKQVVKTVSEFGRCDVPILYGLNFGHSSPICVLPYGASAKIDCDNMQFSILESGVL